MTICKLHNGYIGITPGHNGKELKFSLNFMVIYREDKPQIKFTKVPEARYNMPSWSIDSSSAASKGDFLPHEWETEASKATDFTFNYFKSGEITKVCFDTFQKTADGLECKHEDKRFALEAKVNITADGEPVILFTLKPKEKGWFSVGYIGAPQVSMEAADAIWQPLVWMDRCFPLDSYLTTEFNCPVPTTLVSYKGITYGVVVEPSEMPYRMPTSKNSRFGVLVRNGEGMAQPMAFAPVLGGEESFMEEGSSFCFKVRLIARNQNWGDAFEYIAREIYGFKDYRQNVTCSLSETFFNMVDYAMNDYYSHWNAELKGCSYETDVPGSVKNVSALHMMEIAYVMDNKDIIEERALPVVEYLMSRQKLLFAMDENVKGQGASHFLDGPCIPVSELASLYNLFRGKTPAFINEALKQYDQPASISAFNQVGRSSEKGRTWQNALAVYRATEDKKYLVEAVKLAKEYIKNEVDPMKAQIEDYGMFWVDYVPRWAELTELYEETGDKVFLEAAHKSAKKYCSFVWYCPEIPGGNITVNEGGKTSKYWYARGPEAMNIPEETVPAWRVSEIGLNCEASATGHGHRGIFMAFHAPYMLRLAKYTGDQFLHDTARAAVIGRYTNFPGYHMNTRRSTVYEKFDYPYHEFKELTYNTMHFNHIWPHITMLLDYLVTDVFYKSEGAITFPSQYAECYAYMQSKIYGDRPGSFYGKKGVYLWMPKGVLKTGSEQLNFITGRGQGKFYAVFTNQSDKAVDTNVYLNSSLLPYGKTNNVVIWQQNNECGSAVMNCGVLPVHVEAKGITAIEVDDIEISSVIEELMLKETERKYSGISNCSNSDKSYASLETSFGRAEAMIISLGEDYINNLYVWLSATEKVLKEAHLYYKLDGREHKITDNGYPFEFTVDLGKHAEVELRVEGVTAGGEILKSKDYKLIKD